MELTNIQIEVVKGLYAIQYRKYLKAKQDYSTKVGNTHAFLEYYTKLEVMSHLSEVLSVIGFDIETIEAHSKKEFEKEVKQLEQN